MRTEMPCGYKTPDILANEIEMHRQIHAGAFLVLEGKDDLRFWRARHHENCELVDGEAKINVVRALRLLDSRRFKGALGLVDSDYDTFRSGEQLSPNLVATDAHDLECVLCRSRALEAVLAEHGDASRISRFEDAEGTGVRQALLDRALVFGRVRLAATLWYETDAMRHIRVQRFLDESNWLVDAEALIDTVADCSARDRRAWQSRTDDFQHEDPWFVVRGHDMVEILRIGLRRVLGDVPRTIGVKGLASGLRLAMSREWLEATGLWKGIRGWERANPPFVVLSP